MFSFPKYPLLHNATKTSFQGRQAGQGRARQGYGREALARLPVPRSGGSAALPVRHSRCQREWGGGAERTTLRGARHPRAAARRASNAPRPPACAALLPPLPAPGFEAFVFSGRCDGRKLPGESSGRACAALGSAGHRPRREVFWKGTTLLNRTAQDDL